jgi:hypothetical protein
MQEDSALFMYVVFIRGAGSAIFFFQAVVADSCAIFS